MLKKLISLHCDTRYLYFTTLTSWSTEPSLSKFQGREKSINLTCMLTVTGTGFFIFIIKVFLIKTLGRDHPKKA